jgi:U3 small nucleolar RNA-associated protein 21
MKGAHQADHLQSVAITACGTFALVGSSLGTIDMFNLQSGLHRQRFPAKPKPLGAKLLSTAAETHSKAERALRTSSSVPGAAKHGGAVTGIAVDNVNRTVISCGLDGKLKVI